MADTSKDVEPFDIIVAARELSDHLYSEHFAAWNQFVGLDIARRRLRNELLAAQLYGSGKYQPLLDK